MKPSPPPGPAFSTTNVLELGTGACDEVQLIAAGAGEMLVDDLVVRNVSDAPGASRVVNGGFETSLSGWIAQGNHITSRRQSGGFAGSAGSLRLIATGAGDNGVNRMESDLTAPLLPGDSVAISVKARWLRGNPRLLVRLGGNWMELAVRLPAATAPGTPAAPNRGEVPNLGPTLSAPVQHPVLPAAGQDVVVTVRAADPDGVAALHLLWRADPATNLTATALHDDGIDPDRTAGDGEFSGFIPGQPAGTLVAWQVSATDAPGASARWPARPSAEALVRFGEPPEPGVIPSLRVWMTAANLADWQTRQKLSNALLDCTVVHAGARVVHGAGIRYRGSALIRPIYAGPTNASTQVPGYVIEPPGDDLLLGSTSLNLDGLEQPFRDDTLQRERMAYRMAESLGGAFPNARYTRLSINGWAAGQVVADIQQADGDFLDQWYRGSGGGSLFELNYWFEFNDNAQVSTTTRTDATFQAFTNVTGQLHLPRYRWCFNKKNHGPSGDDHTPVFAIVNALNATNSPAYQAQVEAALDLPQFLHTLALRRIVNDWDGYGFYRSKNAFLYAPPAGGPAALTLWDLDFALGAVGGRPPAFPLFDQIQDPVLAPFFQVPAFRHRFFSLVRAAVDGPLAPAAFNALADEHAAVLAAAGITAANP
ncbi:MAG: CotH kinase family protein, partial [Kiritimatiellia bacterium]